MLRKFRIIGIFLMVIMWLISGCSDDTKCICATISKTIFVNPEGTGDFTTIQEAIDAADSLDVIELGDGTFTGTGNRDLDFKGKTITVKSRSGRADRCIIDCQDIEHQEHRGFIFQSGESRWSILDAITITGGFYFNEWREPGGAAVCCMNGSSPTLRNCVFYNNEASYGASVWCYQLSSPRLLNCTVVGNYGGSGAGVYCLHRSSPVLENTIVCFNEGGGVINCSSNNCYVLLTNCNIFGNTGSSTSCLEDQMSHYGNISKDPKFCDFENADYRLQTSSPCCPDSSNVGLIGALPVGCGE